VEFATRSDQLEYNVAIWTSERMVQAEDTDIGEFLVGWKEAKPLHDTTVGDQGIPMPS
jgi:hypothetical protein